MTVQEYKNGIFSLEMDMTRAFVITGSQRALLLDSGWGREDVLCAVRGVTALPLVYVNTHADNDHIGATADFGAETWIHPLELPALREKLGADFSCHACLDGACFALGGRELVCLHTPGHSPGSLSLLDEATGSIFTGDSVSEEFVFMTGAQRSLPALCETLRRLEAMPRIVRVFPSHGPCPLEPSIFGRVRGLAQSVLDGQPCAEIREIPGSELRGGVTRSFLRSIAVYEKDGLQIFRDPPTA